MFSTDRIMKQLVGVLPQGWTKTILFVNLTASSHEVFFYTQVNGKYIQCFELCSISDITRGELRKVFKAICDIVREDWAEHGWSVLTLKIEANGKFSADFSFDDISEKQLEYYEEWKKKYLCS